MGELNEDVSALGSIVDIAGSLFGGTTSQTGTTTGRSTARQTEQTILDEAAIAKFIEDVLGSAEGLASIFGGEQSVGLFDSSVAAQASGDLVSKLVGELAKLTSQRVTTQEAEQEQTTQTEKKDEGILSGIGDFFGF